MRAIKLALFIFLALFQSSQALARDEDFGIFQFRKKLENDNQIFMEYARRDRGELFQKRFLDIYRLSWGGKLGEWTYLLGGAYVDFETGVDEKRLHQFFIRTYAATSWLKGFGRIAFEERIFDDDGKIHLRGRFRGQANIVSEQALGLSIYDEAFYVADGQGRFVEGFNENRFGVGLRYEQPGLEVYLFHVTGYWQTLKSSDQFEWLQIQTVFSF